MITELYHPIFAILIIVTAFATSHFIQKKYRLYSGTARFESIDGLRGFLAISVFIHHSAIWYEYAVSGKWKIPSSDLYDHLGSTSVAFFFMITSFLFTNKLLNSSKPISWKTLYISRLYRLLPLNIVAVLLLVFIIFLDSGFELKQPFLNLMIRISKWFAFGVKGYPAINEYENTKLAIASVVWSLPYEWFFYLILPFLYILLLRKLPSIFTLLICGSIAYLFYQYLKPFLLWYFVAGTIAPIYLKYSRSQINFNSIYVSIFLLITFSVLIFSASRTTLTLFLATVIFNLVALGNNMFGILKINAVKFLGELSYSTYLMHGLLLYFVFHLIMGEKEVASLEITSYWMIIILLTPILVIFNSITYSFIEKPFMKMAKKN